MQITIKQSEKKHDINQLHDELIRAGFKPWPVESTDTESRLTFLDETNKAAIQGVIEKHIPEPKPVPDLDMLWKSVKSAKNFGEMQAALVLYEEAKHPERKIK